MPKAIRELADEFGVSKQAIREKTRCKLELLLIRDTCC
ncbi:Hypothetical protein ADU71_0006 (plasmid) [Pediococcus damnosus]|nr:Hypothetical protein ADU69_0071 [Pediococcus damnosus]AMV66016.1 Hypothetical protein ADU71_0006 [Pediococcus damnosus]